MSKTKFHEVNGCTHFIPVQVNELFERSADITIYGKGFRMVVDRIYSFPIEDKSKKPVIPQFVAEWIEECKEAKRSLYNVLEENNEVNCWLERDEKIRENEDTFARAWLDGYEVEKEKLYTVKIAEATLTKITRGSNVQYKMLPFGDISDVFDKVIYTTRLTEQEIKQADERLWQFAKEVVE